MGARVTVYDPAALDNARRARPEISYAPTLAAAAQGAHVVLLLTEWPEFTTLTPDRLGGIVARRNMIDARNALDPVRWREAGWEYRALGGGRGHGPGAAGRLAVTGVGPPGRWIRFRQTKALVLAGGSGSRLRPITHTYAKQLVPVANKPVLFYGLEAIRDAGISDVGIVVGDTAAAIQEEVGDGSAFGLDVTYIQQDAPRGLAHAVLIARDFLGEDDFVMYLGDNFIVGGITALVDEFANIRPDAQIMLTRVTDPRQFGVAELDSAGEVTGLVEKPQHPK